jgi:hypothetical protein
MTRTVAALAVAMSAAVSAQPSISDQALQTKCEALDSAGHCTRYGVSMVELLARPEMFHGKRVRVIGYVRLEFEGNAIYLSKESYEAAIAKNALWLDPPIGSALAKKGAKWGPRYAIVEGRFDATMTGHMGSFSGAITDTTRLEPWKIAR